MTQKFIAFLSAVAVSALATSAMAQATTQGTIIGPSGDADYPVRVQADNGFLYNCEAPDEDRTSNEPLACRRVGRVVAAVPSAGGAAGGSAGGGVGAGAGAGMLGGGIPAAAALAAGLVGAVAFISASDTQ